MSGLRDKGYSRFCDETYPNAHWECVGPNASVISTIPVLYHAMIATAQMLVVCAALHGTSHSHA